VTNFLKLLFIALTNPFYNLGLGLWELSVFWRFGWWWRLRALLFIYYFADSPFAVVKREGPRLPVPLQNLIYGETPCISIQKILLELNPGSDDCFVDLGCGRGLSVFFARQYLNIPAIGIELVPTFVSRAQKIARRLKLSGVEFIRENLSWIVAEQIGRGTIFYLAGTAFDDELLNKIATRLETLPPGVRLITLSEPFPSPLFRVTAIKSCYFSWGKTEVYYQEKLN
jgi:hypothetical protein